MSEFKVPVVKGKTFISVESDLITDEAFYREVFLQGLKVVINRGTSKITKTTYPDAEELKAAATAQAEKLLAALYAGDTKLIKLTGTKVKKSTGQVLTEARRIAKELVKAEMKAQKIKVSHVKASEITKAANMLLETEQGAKITEMAEANIAERSKQPSLSIDLKSIIQVDPELVAKEAAKKKDKPLSAKQAGLAAKRAAKPSAQATAH